MKKFLFVLFAFSAPALSGTETTTGHTPLSGVYRVYGGGIVDSIAPDRKDSKIMFAVRGQVARDMFSAMGPDVPDECTAGSGTRVRTKDNGKLWCSRSKLGEYSCNFGFQLRTGKSIGGIAC